MNTQTAPEMARSVSRRAAHRIERFSYERAPGAAPGGRQRQPAAGQLDFKAHARPDGAGGFASSPSAASELEQARAEAYQQGGDAAQAKLEDDLRRERQALGKALDEFAQDRFRYFRRVEKEVVELAMSIAKRILHREAQMDPLVLQGAVRAVLDRVSDSSGSTMRLHPERIAMWEAWFDSHQVRQRPKLLADTTLSTGQCVLETSMGTTDIGLEAQLREIENGFCDLLASRNLEGGSGSDSANSPGGQDRK